jgi:hypothetical protein
MKNISEAKKIEDAYGVTYEVSDHSIVLGTNGGWHVNRDGEGRVASGFSTPQKALDWINELA